MTIVPAQRAVVEFLLGLSSGRLRETHISAVFIGDDTVWKLKKAVRLEFLDFSTLSARRHFLLRELALNRPAAEGIYRDVVAVVRCRDGTLGFGDGPVVDWVLRMARVPDDDFLDIIAEQGGLTAELLDALGDCVALYHARLSPVHDWDSPAAMLRLTQGNARSAIAAGLPPGEVEAWRQAMEAAIEQLRPWLAERAGAGFVRRCHGDLHLGNLCLWNRMPVPFDALEFDEAMATTDTGYDLAFLLMDLERRVDRAAANRVMNRAIARSGDALAVRGFPSFLSQRAMVRAHVSAASGRPADAERYLAAAHGYLLPSRGFVLAVGGLPGSGKSTLARLLAPEMGGAPGAVVLRSDEIRKRLHGAAPEARLPPDAYSDAANAAVNALLLEHAAALAGIGHAVVVDATFLDPGLRRAVAAAAEPLPFLGVWLDVPLADLEQRVASRVGDASDATPAVLRRMAAAGKRPRDWLWVDATDTARAASVVRRAMAACVGVAGALAWLPRSG